MVFSAFDMLGLDIKTLDPSPKKRHEDCDEALGSFILRKSPLEEEVKGLNMTRKMNIAVIGTGRMGSVHVRNLVRSIPEANLVAICDIRLDVAQAWRMNLASQRVVKDYHDLLADKSIEAVLIATSTDTHAFIMKDVAAAGKHIFCEKPLALDLDSIDDALAVVEKAGVKLQVGFNRRFDKSFQRVHQIVDSGEIWQTMHPAHHQPRPGTARHGIPRVSGGMFLDMTIHDFDMARFLIGDVEEIYAIGNVLVAPELNEIGDVDTNIVTLKFANGALGTIDNSRQAVYGYDQRLEVFCSNGIAMAANETVKTTVVKEIRNGFHSARIPHFFMKRYAPCYVEEVQQFIECVREDKPTQ